MNISDTELIDGLFRRNNNALAQLETKYGRLVTSVCENIVRNCEDAEECANDTYLKVWESIPPAKPQNFMAYICRIARNISIDRLRYKQREKRSGEVDNLLSELDECIPASDSTEQSADDTLKKSLDSFLKRLSHRDRSIFIRRYFYCDSVKNIADRFSIRETNVTTILGRLRNKLKAHLLQDGITV